jgi:hypothetical protein
LDVIFPENVQSDNPVRKFSLASCLKFANYFVVAKTRLVLRSLN